MKEHFLLIRDKLVEFKFPCVMGVININDDSFYSDSRICVPSQLVEKISKMIDDGATIIDIGAVSSRPFSELVSAKDELNRLVPALKLVRKEFPNIIISIDTYRAETVEVVADLGADIINDISSGNIDENMLNTVAKSKLPYVIMHMNGTPADMQLNPKYENLIFDLQFFFASKINRAIEAGIYDLIIDPGFGFGKTTEQNYKILDSLQLLKIHNKPILVGLSRKSMIYKTLNNTPETALNGTTSLNTIALLKGADILRVHDVKEAVEIIKLLSKMSLQND